MLVVRLVIGCAGELAGAMQRAFLAEPRLRHGHRQRRDLLTCAWLDGVEADCRWAFLAGSEGVHSGFRGSSKRRQRLGFKCHVMDAAKAGAKAFLVGSWWSSIWRRRRSRVSWWTSQHEVPHEWVICAPTGCRCFKLQTTQS